MQASLSVGAGLICGAALVSIMFALLRFRQPTAPSEREAPSDKVTLLGLIMFVILRFRPDREAPSEKVTHNHNSETEPRHISQPQECEYKLVTEPVTLCCYTWFQFFSIQFILKDSHCSLEWYLLLRPLTYLMPCYCFCLMP